MSFDIKFTRQDFENACAEPGKLDIKRCERGYSIYQLTSGFKLQTSDYDVIIEFCVVRRNRRYYSKSATSCRSDNETCREIANVYQVNVQQCNNNAINVRGK